MRLATWNLARQSAVGRYAPAIRQQIDAQRADVWVFSETRTLFGPGSPGGTTAFSGPREQPARPDERWIGIWSRWPVSALETEDPQRTACAIVERPRGRPLIVYGTVLPWTSDTWRGRTRRGFDTFRAALELQRADWARLRAGHPEADLCVMGDLNQDLVGPLAYGSRRGRELLASALAELDLVPVALLPEAPVLRLTRGLRGAIDHVVISGRAIEGKAVRAAAWEPARVDGRPVSDHHGIVLLPDPRSGDASGEGE